MKKVTLLIILILACLVLVGASCKEIKTIIMGGAVITSTPAPVKNMQDTQKTPSDESVENPSETKPSRI